MTEIVLLSGCDLWRSHFSRHHGCVVPVLGNHWPPAAAQPYCPHSGGASAPVPVLQVPRTGPLQHHTGGHHHYFSMLFGMFSRILGEWAVGLDLWPCRAFTSDPSTADPRSLGSRRGAVPGGVRDAGSDPADGALGESAGALSNLRSVCEWRRRTQEERDRGAV